MSKMIVARSMIEARVVDDPAPMGQESTYLGLEAFAEQGGTHLLVEPTDDVLGLKDKLDGVERIAINFPVFGDGRGYTHAKRLREELGFRGELRAVGDIGKDQLVYLARVGFDGFCLRKGTDLEEALSAFEGFEHFYRGVRTHGRNGA